MRTATVCQQFARDSMIGPVKQQYYLLKNLVKRGHECVVYTTRDISCHEEEEIDGIVVRRYYSLFGYGHYDITPRMLADLVREKADIIHVMGYRNFQTDIGAITSVLRRMTLVLTAHGGLTLYRTLSRSWIESFPNRIYDLLTFKFSLFAASRIVVTSKQEAREAVAFGIPTWKIVLIPHGIEPPPHRPDGSEKKMQKDTMLFLGRLTPVRNLEFLLRGCKLIVEERPETRLLIVGDVLPSRFVPSELNYKTKLLRLCKELKIVNNVRFMGPLRGDELWDIFRSSDLFVYTSIYDNFGLALAEAAVMGKPIISTPVGIAPDLVGENEGGIIIEHNDVVGLKNAVLKLLLDDVLYRSMQTTVMKRAEMYSVDAMVDRYEKLFKDLA